LPKPWLDLEGYRAARLLEARYEAELAERFLEQGLTRALLGAMLTRHVGELERVFPGYVRIREGRRMAKAHWILALVPAPLMKRLSVLLGPETSMLTSVALHLHEYRCNGPDPQGVLSPYPDEESARADVALLVGRVRDYLSGLV